MLVILKRKVHPLYVGYVTSCGGSLVFGLQLSFPEYNFDDWDGVFGGGGLAYYSF